MSNVGEKRECPTCHEFVLVVELIPNKEREGWHIQKLSCSHTGNIRIMEPIEEKTAKHMQKKLQKTQEVFLVKTRIVGTQEHNINS